MSIKEIYQTMEYGPAPESNKESVAFLDSHKRKFSLFINGKWTKPSSGEYFESFSPATTQNLAQIAEANEKDVDDAVKAAKKALKPWVELGGLAELDICMLSPDKSKNTVVTLQYWNLWTMENLSAKLGTLIFHWSQGIFIIMLVGLNSWIRR